MKKLIISLSMALGVIALSLLFMRTNIFGIVGKTYVILPMVIGQLISLYLLTAIVVWLLNKLPSSIEKQLLVAIFMLGFALLWKISFIENVQNAFKEIQQEARQEFEKFAEKNNQECFDLMEMAGVDLEELKKKL